MIALGSGKRHARSFTSALEPPRTQPCCLSMSSSSSARRLRTCAVACTHAVVSEQLTFIPYSTSTTCRYPGCICVRTGQSNFNQLHQRYAYM